MVNVWCVAAVPTSSTAWITLKTFILVHFKVKPRTCYPQSGVSLQTLTEPQLEVSSWQNIPTMVNTNIGAAQTPCSDPCS